MRPRRPIPLWYWLLWMVLLALGLVVFYVVLTPVWMGVRLVAWLFEGGFREFRPGERERI